MANFIATHQWYLKITVTFVIGFVISIADYASYSRLMPRLKKRGSLWTVAIWSAIHRPIQIYIWLLVITFLLTIFAQQFSFVKDINTAIGATRLVLTCLLIFWFLMRLIKSTELSFIERARRGQSHISDPTSINAIAQLVRVAIMIVVLLVVLQTIGVKMSALLAFGGVTTAVVGFAARDSLGNFIGGMMLYWDRPFSVGDWVRSPDRNIEGTVEHIGWRLTRIRTFDKRPLYVPNGVLSNIAIENPSRMTNRRIKALFGVRYDDANQVRGITTAIEEMLQTHPDIDQNQTTFVAMVEFGASSLEVLIYTFTKTTEWVKFQRIQQDVFIKILHIISSFGAECAFPTQTLHIPNDVLVDLKEGASDDRRQYGNHSKEEHAKNDIA